MPSSSATRTASCTPSARVTAAALWTYKTTQEIKSSPVVVEGLVLIGSYDGNLYALDAASGKLKWKVETDGPVHATPAIHNGVAYIAGCDEHFRAIRIADGRELFKIRRGRQHRCLARHRRAIAPTSARSATKSSRIDLKARKIVWRYENPERQFPVLLLGGAGRRPGDRRQPRQGAPCDRRRDRQARLDLHDAERASTRRRRSPASRVYVGSSDGRLYVLDVASGTQGVRVRRRRGDHGLAGDRRRPCGGRHDRRPTVLLRIGLRLKTQGLSQA